jgi:hypothetical protein
MATATMAITTTEITTQMAKTASKATAKTTNHKMCRKLLIMLQKF